MKGKIVECHSCITCHNFEVCNGGYYICIKEEPLKHPLEKANDCVKYKIKDCKNYNENMCMHLCGSPKISPNQKNEYSCYEPRTSYSIVTPKLNLKSFTTVELEEELKQRELYSGYDVIIDPIDRMSREALLEIIKSKDELELFIKYLTRKVAEGYDS